MGHVVSGRNKARSKSPGRPLALILVAVSALATPPDLFAQSAAATTLSPEGFLAPDHWSRLVLRRVAAEGLAPVARIGEPWSFRLSSVREDLERATRAAPTGSASRAALGDIVARLEADHGSAPRALKVLDVEIYVGGEARRGERIAGSAVASDAGFDYGSPPAVPDRNQAFVRVSGFGGIGPFIAGFDIESDAWLRQLDVSARAGPLDIRFGRQPLAFGPGTEEGIVLGPRVAFDGLGVAMPDAIALPSFLNHLGGLRASLLVARMDASGEVARPWFAASRLSFEPSRSWVIGLNRAVIFGGEGNEAVTGRRLLLVLVGETDSAGKDSDFENQVASVDVAVRLGGRFAMLAYLEYGVDDSGFAFLHVPGLLAGIEAERIPGLDRVALGIEVTAFRPSCCGYPAWYRHGRLAAGWSDSGKLLGNALGGHGEEAAITWRIDPGRSRFLGSGRLFFRNRGAENVFAPDWSGSSAGSRLRFSLPLSAFIRIDGDAELEVGKRWHRGKVSVAFAGWITRAGT